ncbi:hypothetical protein [Clostridium sporogenes]|uniref:hypothetical protein n=1 Tax=Clostridium sporogenes TaxID=1509 RepID=UPI000697185A|nr:hypothetical protein [Clostridium sporogenes]MBY7015140.1 hypothetical protein [Clostridium sporogenes]NFD94560.1 hypothetical protein [Clostridium sporogenes]NFE45425.1 hypothetical protein [Clostridium sporogenes]NFF16118.1 hypothetical protein [Clostridium sporogenes]NFF73667.1 hypothetical protein [Clostridium sporogenes]
MREIMFRGKDKLGNWRYGYFHADTITGEDKYYINSRISVDNPEFIEVIPETVGQMTDSTDIDGNPIWEGNLVNQRSVLIGDGDNIDFTGYVKFSEGQWLIDNAETAIPLWSEHRENKIIE